MSSQVDKNRPSHCESDAQVEHPLIKTPEQLLKRLLSRRNLLAQSLGGAGVLGALLLQAGAATKKTRDKNDELCISRDDIRRLALSAGTTVQQASQEVLSLVVEADGDRERFTAIGLQRLQDQRAITRREKELLQEMATVVFDIEQSEEKIIRKLNWIFKGIARRPNASPVAVGFASIALETERASASSIFGIAKARNNGGDNHDGGQLCISRGDTRRLALSAGTTVQQASQEVLSLVVEGDGDRERFTAIGLQQLQDQRAITRREKELLQEMATVVFDIEQSEEEIISKVGEISGEIAGQRNASPVALAFASMGASLPDFERSLGDLLDELTEGGFSPSEIFGRFVIGFVIGGIIGGLIGGIIGGPFGATFGTLIGGVIGAGVAIALPFLIDFFEDASIGGFIGGILGAVSGLSAGGLIGAVGGAVAGSVVGEVVGGAVGAAIGGAQAVGGAVAGFVRGIFG